MKTDKPYTRLCDGCVFLVHEERPGGAGAFRCMDPDSRRPGRTLDYSRADLFNHIYTPVWCESGRKE